MMRAMRNKYNVKVVSFIVAAVFVLGIGAYAMMERGPSGSDLVHRRGRSGQHY